PGWPDAAPGDAAPGDAAPPDARVVDGAPADGAPPPADAATAVDAGGDCASEPVPLDVPPGVWTWVPVDGMRCANGEPTGIGVNLAPGGARRMLIYLIGGGACWDQRSCYRDGRAAFVEEGFGPAQFAQLALPQFWFFDRTSPEN